MAQTVSLGPPLRLTQTAYQAQTQRRNCRVLSNLILDSSPDISRSATTKTGSRAAGLKHHRQQRHHPHEKPQSSSHRRRQRTKGSRSGIIAHFGPDHIMMARLRSATRRRAECRCVFPRMTSPRGILPQAGTTSPNWPLGLRDSLSCGIGGCRTSCGSTTSRCKTTNKERVSSRTWGWG
jgi:hypothetical protein